MTGTKITDTGSLIRLLDDPDERVYQAVIKKILEVGPAILPDLEAALLGAASTLIHERYQQVIKKLRTEQIAIEMREWDQMPNAYLPTGAWLITRFQFPDTSFDDFYKMLKPLRDEIWLELNDQLTALEKTRVINHILFTKHQFHLNEKQPESPGNNFLNRLIETGNGNEHSLTLLYATLAQELRLPLFTVDLPEYPILAYLDIPVLPDVKIVPGGFDILFYVNPVSGGTVHGRRDIAEYLKKKSFPDLPGFYVPSGNQVLIARCFEKLGRDYLVFGNQVRADMVNHILQKLRSNPDENPDEGDGI
jgi:hypothetical protein